MLDYIFNAASLKVSVIMLVIFLASSFILYKTNPKNEIIEFFKQQNAEKEYVATDLTFAYDLDKVRAMFARYDKGPHFEAHKRFILLHDLVYPLCYSIPGALILAYLLTVVSPGGHRDFRFLVLLPLLAAVADYAENFSMYAYLSSYPNGSLGVLKFSRAMTILKISLLITSSFLLFALLARLIWLHLPGVTHARKS